jgi:hypothetical protein
MLGHMPMFLGRAENTLGTETRHSLPTRIARYRPASKKTPHPLGIVNPTRQMRAPEPSSPDKLALRSVHFFSWSVEGLTAPTEKAGEGLGPPMVSAATSTDQSMRA